MIRLLLVTIAGAAIAGCALSGPGVTRTEWQVETGAGQGERLVAREVREPVPGPATDGAAVHSFLVSADVVELSVPGRASGYAVERRLAAFAATRQPDRLRQRTAAGQPGEPVGIPAFEYGRAVPSPDGKLVAVACREWPESAWGIWVMPPDATSPAFLHAGCDPAWLDSSTLLFVAPVDGRQAIWTMRLDGTGRRPLVTDPQADCRQPETSRDGRRLLFVKERGGRPEARDIWLCELADGQQTELTLNPSRDDLPRFGADDRHVYFRSTRGGTWGIWRLPVPAPPTAAPTAH